MPSAARPYAHGLTGVRNSRRDLAHPTADAGRSALRIAASLAATALLAAAQAAIIPLLVEPGAKTDVFFAAYAIYLPVATLAASMRSSLVPLLGDPAGPGFVDRAGLLLRRTAAVGILGAVGLAAAIPLWRHALGSGIRPDLLGEFTVTILLLAAAAYLQVHAAALSSVLVAVRRFDFSAAVYPAGSVVGLAVSAALLPALGVIGAAVGVLVGVLAVALAHTAYLWRFGVRVGLPWRDWNLRGVGAHALYVVGSAALGWSMQITLAAALAALPARAGSITAYSYAFFIVALVLNVSSLPLGMVRFPDFVADARAGGAGASTARLERTISLAFAAWAPLAAVIVLFSSTLVEPAVALLTNERIGAETAQASQALCAFGGALLVLQLVHAATVAVGRWRVTFATNGAASLVAVLVFATLHSGSPTRVALVQAALAALTALVLLRATLGPPAARFVLVLVRSVAPALPLLGTVLGARLLAGSHAAFGVALTWAVVGLAAYAVLAAVLWPSVTAPVVARLRAWPASRSTA